MIATHSLRIAQKIGQITGSVAQIAARDTVPDGTSMCIPRACNPSRPCAPDSNDGCRPKSCAPAR